VGQTDQRSKIETFDIAPTYTHVINANTVFNFGPYIRRDAFNYYPSKNAFADLGPIQQETVAQQRSLTNAGVHTDISYVKGIHNIKIGGVYGQTFLRENDQIGIVDPNLNEPTSDTFNPILSSIDLTRGGSLYSYHGQTDVKQLALYGQDQITLGSWLFNVGIRGDFYNGLAIQRQAEPRAGVSYNFKKTNTVLRVSTPAPWRPLSTRTWSSQAPVASTPSFRQSSRPSAPALPRPSTPDSATSSTPDSSRPSPNTSSSAATTSGSTPTTPTTSAFSAARPSPSPSSGTTRRSPASPSAPTFLRPTASAPSSSCPRWRHASSTRRSAASAQRPVLRAPRFPSASTTTRSTTRPRTCNTTCPFRKSMWLGFNWRYDSGLTAGSVPCYNPTGANSLCTATSITLPNGQPGIDLSGLTPDQQFQAGLTCDGVAATPTSGFSSCDVNGLTSQLVKIPAPNTEDDDKNPPRIAPRSLFDIALGDDNLFHTDKHQIGLRITAVNVSNKYALYNFLSTFSGTHYVSPRAITGQITYNF